jgi:hypothetical protein
LEDCREDLSERTPFQEFSSAILNEAVILAGMANDRADEILTLNGKPRPAGMNLRTVVPDLFSSDPAPAASYDAYAPYSAAWKEYDKLQKLGKGGRSWVLDVAIALFGTTGLFDARRHRKPYELTVFAFVSVLAAYRALRGMHAKSLLAHWRCPRCHAEWPGEKLDKGPQCTLCGLKLHEMWS